MTTPAQRLDALCQAVEQEANRVEADAHRTFGHTPEQRRLCVGCRSADTLRRLVEEARRA